MMGVSFVRVGKFRVSEFQIASVQFNDDGSATVHTMSNNVSTADPDEVKALHELVGDDPPEPMLHPAPDPPADALAAPAATSTATTSTTI